MGIFSLSDIVIAATLLVNAIALMSSRTYKLTSSTSASSGSASASASAYGTTSADPYESAQEETEPLNREAEEPEGHEQGLDKDSDEGEGDERGRGRGSRAIIRSREGEGREGLGREDRENREGREDREGEGKIEDGGAVSRFYMLLNGVRSLSCLIVLWNVFFVVLMLVVFRS
ncbi:hypothetical protein B484DRAFT_397905 [Ochromonadaceae sp. CCMP2298]|nr:hypothetical protein B484DRAFT_397905 [Ochromonadaceae sp. CCMP2298]